MVVILPMNTSTIRKYCFFTMEEKLADDDNTDGGDGEGDNDDDDDDDDSNGVVFLC